MKTRTSSGSSLEKPIITDHILPLVESGKIEIIKSEGCYLYDNKENKYTDMESGVWCVNLGHNHKRINRIIQRQVVKASYRTQ